MLDAHAQLERLYREHRRDVYRLALRDLGNREDAEDATQAAFLNAYRALVRGDLPRKPRSWLLAIAENVCRRRFRGSGPALWPLDEEQLEAPSREEPLLDEIVTSLGGLSETQRSVLVLRELGDFSYAEISDRVGLSVQAVQMQLFRARRRFRQELSVRRASLAVSWLPRLLDVLRGSHAASTAVPLVAATVAAGVFVAAPAPAPDAGRGPVAVVAALQAPRHVRSAPAAPRHEARRTMRHASAPLRTQAEPAPASRAARIRTAPTVPAPATSALPPPPAPPQRDRPTVPAATERAPAPPRRPLPPPPTPSVPAATLPAPPVLPDGPKLPALPTAPKLPPPPAAPRLPTVSTNMPAVPSPPVTGLPAPSP